MKNKLVAISLISALMVLAACSLLEEEAPASGGGSKLSQYIDQISLNTEKIVFFQGGEIDSATLMVEAEPEVMDAFMEGGGFNWICYSDAITMMSASEVISPGATAKGLKSVLIAPSKPGSTWITVSYPPINWSKRCEVLVLQPLSLSSIANKRVEKDGNVSVSTRLTPTAAAQLEDAAFEWKIADENISSVGTVSNGGLMATLNGLNNGRTFVTVKFSAAGNTAQQTFPVTVGVVNPPGGLPSYHTMEVLYDNVLEFTYQSAEAHYEYTDSNDLTSVWTYVQEDSTVTFNWKSAFAGLDPGVVSVIKNANGDLVPVSNNSFIMPRCGVSISLKTTSPDETGAYIFKEDSIFVRPQDKTSFNVLVVAGGGGGGAGRVHNDGKGIGGGGGAGGYYANANYTITDNLLPVIVGAGGKGGTTADNGGYGNDGENTIFGNIESGGGGGGASWGSGTAAKTGRNGKNAGRTNGSGGGGGGHVGNSTGGAGGTKTGDGLNGFTVNSGQPSANSSLNAAAGSGADGPGTGAVGTESQIVPGPGITNNITGTAVEYSRGGLIANPGASIKRKFGEGGYGGKNSATILPIGDPRVGGGGGAGIVVVKPN
jgi:hypothetical protein